MSEKIQTAKVELWYGSYHGIVEIFCNENDDNDCIIAKAFREAECNFLPMAYKKGKILSRVNIE